MTKKYFYYIKDQNEDESDAVEISCKYDESDSELISELAAENEWLHHDGWEWMYNGVNELVLLREDKTEIGTFEIFFNSVPEFSAAKK